MMKTTAEQVCKNVCPKAGCLEIFPLSREVAIIGPSVDLN